MQGCGVKTYTQSILCVDDDSATLRVRRLLLEAAGYTVLTADSGAKALELLAQGVNANLVLLDYLMPGMNGDELAEKLREAYPDLPLVVISAVGQLPTRMLRAVNSRLQKGQDPEVLLSTVSTVLGQAEDQPRNEQLPPRKTVLCVEDEQLELQLRKMLLESAGFSVLQAKCASTAMEVFRSQPVDAVVMDYWLSGTNGTTVAEEMKRLRPRTPIVMLSGFCSLPGEGAVVDAWLRKADIEPEDLVNEVRRLIDLRAYTQQTPE
jgi:CheY-like chemotaxis protein